LGAVFQVPRITIAAQKPILPLLPLTVNHLHCKTPC
jgi:hypothetical protein